MATGPGPRQGFMSKMILAKFTRPYIILSVTCQSNDQKSAGGVITVGNVKGTGELFLQTDNGDFIVNMLADPRDGYSGNTAHEVYATKPSYFLTKEDVSNPVFFDGITTAANYGAPIGIIGTGGSADAIIPLSFISSPATITLKAIGQKVTEGPATYTADGGASFGFAGASKDYKEGAEVTVPLSGIEDTLSVPLYRVDKDTGERIQLEGGGAATQLALGNPATSVTRVFRFDPKTRIVTQTA